MDIDQLKIEYEKEMQFDISEISSISLKIPAMRAKYLNHLEFVERSIYRLENENKSKYNELYVHYRTDFEIELSTKEIKDFIDGDVKFLDNNRKMKKLKAMADWLEGAIKGVDNLQWTIKNIITWEMFQAGF